MTLEEIYEEWAKDGEIDVLNVSRESSSIPKLHNKYFRLYMTEGLKLKKLRAEYKQLYKLKGEYYRGELDVEELKQYGWQPFGLRVLKSDVNSYVDADTDIINKTLKIGLQESIVEYLESIIKQINNRGFQLKTIVDWERFRTGAM